MNVTWLKEKSIWIAPALLILYVFFLPLSASLKSIMCVCSLVAILLTPYYRHYLRQTFSTSWGRVAVVFFLYVVLACLWSTAPFSMQLSMIDKYAKLIYLPILAVGFIHPKTRQWSFNVYFLAILITCVVSLLKQHGFLLINKPDDSGEVFFNHIATGYMISVAVYFAALLSFRSNLSTWTRVYYFVVVAVGSYQIFFLNTGRTGYITYVVLMTLLLLQKLPLKKAAVGVLLLGMSLGVVYSISPLLQSRLASLVSDIKFLQQHQEDTSLGFRVQFHEYAKSLFVQHPIIGIGTGSFKYRFRVEQPLPNWSTRLNDPHSQYWLTLTEQGIIGLGMLLLFMGTLFMAALKLDKETRPFLLGLLVSFALGCFTDSIFCYSTAGSLLTIISALCLSEVIDLKAGAIVRKSQSAINDRSDVLDHVPNQSAHS